MVRVFVCTTMIHIRLTKMKFELLTTPFLDQFHTAVDSRKQLRDEVERMTAFIHPAIEAVENPDPGFTPDNSTIATEPKNPDKVTAVDYVEGYRGKLYSQCLYQIKETQRVCRQNYTHLYLKCVETVTLIQTYCDPFKVENYCSISKVLESILDKSGNLDLIRQPYYISDSFWVNARVLLRHHGCNTWTDGQCLQKVDEKQKPHRNCPKCWQRLL